MNKEFLKKCWENKRTHALMVLILWIVALSLLMGITTLLNQFSAPKNKIETKNEETISYDEIWQNLLNTDYEFRYVVTLEEEKIEYNGKVEENKISGYRENKEGILKYEIEDGISYELVMGERKPLETLYENVNKDYFSLDSLYTLLKDTPVEEEDLLYTYEVNENVDIQVLLSKENKIQTITIQEESTVYELNFTY